MCGFGIEKCSLSKVKLPTEVGKSMEVESKVRDFTGLVESVDELLSVDNNLFKALPL